MNVNGKTEAHSMFIHKQIKFIQLFHNKNRIVFENVNEYESNVSIANHKTRV